MAFFVKNCKNKGTLFWPQNKELSGNLLVWLRLHYMAAIIFVHHKGSELNVPAGDVFS